jgi:alanine racemase
MDNKRPTWAEIDLATIKNNLECIRNVLSPKSRIMAVVKADAYGHGMKEISCTCVEEGVDFLAVATLDEAMQLIKYGVKATILVLGYIPRHLAQIVVNYGIRTSVYDLPFAQSLSAAAQALGKPAHIHLKIDTGMGRIGFAPLEESLTIIQEIAALPGINLEGIFTHFTEADSENDDYSMIQYSAFKDFNRELASRGIEIPLQHCANSAAIFRYPETHLDLVRAGIVLYGLYPSPFMKKSMNLGIKPAMRLKSRISMVKKLASGHGVSYGRTHICSQDTWVATIPIGYADGYSRAFSNRAWAMIKGKKAHSLGVVCMDQCMFDIGGREDIVEGDEAVLFGTEADGITADDLALIANTINYEIVCSVSSRVPRIYV